MGMTRDDYLTQLLALLPAGPAWSVVPGDSLHDMLSAWASVAAEAEAAFAALVDEADPRTTSVLLSDWERVAALPDACELAFGGEQSDLQRRLALLARLLSQGGLSRAYYLEVIEALGYTATITEFHATSVGDDVAAPINGESWEAAWQINVAMNSVTFFDVTGDVASPLAWWGNSLLECVLHRLNRAGATLVFNYS